MRYETCLIACVCNGPVECMEYTYEMILSLHFFDADGLAEFHLIEKWEWENHTHKQTTIQTVWKQSKTKSSNRIKSLLTATLSEFTVRTNTRTLFPLCNNCPALAEIGTTVRMWTLYE